MDAATTESITPHPCHLEIDSLSYLIFYLKKNADVHNIMTSQTVWEEVVNTEVYATTEWAAFGYISAEAELAGRRQRV